MGGPLARKATLGEFEHLVLLAALRLGEEAHAPEIARVLEQRARREISRGTLYAALKRLEERGLIEWFAEDGTGKRGPSRRRRFSVTKAGRTALVDQREMLMSMWTGIDELLPDKGS
jgi:DNA-binding PadR family transcriptional regulator